MIDLTKISKDGLYRKKEVAALCGICTKTLERWIAKGFPDGKWMYGIKVWSGEALIKHIRKKSIATP